MALALSHCGSDDNPAGLAGNATPYRLDVPAGFPALEIPRANPLTVEGVELGRLLFFDPILSIDSTVACASCHGPENAFSDSETFSRGVAGVTGRNSMSLLNVAWGPSFFWDGRAASLEEQALIPVEDPVEMGESWPHVVEKLARHPSYPALFAAAFGARPISKELAARAIAQFERTLISNQSKYDRYLAGEAELTLQEHQGSVLFLASERGDCFHCHGTGLFTDNLFHNNGLDSLVADAGLGAITGNRLDEGKFKTPSLRNVEYTAPYMHDGRFTTLEEVVEFYNSGVHVTRNTPSDLILAARVRRENPLTEEEKAALVAFLKTLSDPQSLQSQGP
ncbi:MAG: cytochrome-c peroxidase [Candidatus Latescibacteria bacterium]|nr:cytochrome-c peroxidase [Candidatus Latescibacterota bacterium]